MPAIIISILVIIIGASIAFYVISTKRKQRYTEFVTQHSFALKELANINSKYKFYSVSDSNEYHTHDNVNNYNNVSCRDYLIYQLQFKQREVKNDISLAESNKASYSLYKQEVERIDCFGQFDEPIENMKFDSLVSIEKTLFRRKQLKPATSYHYNVKLYNSDMNGSILNSKSDSFNSDQIKNLINKLNNRNGDFYNDREIWDALCRVERGKVSNKMRFSIYKRDGYRCRRCGRSGMFNDLEIDHIRPISKGGKTEYNNLQTLCRRCNKEKGDSW